MPDRTVFVAGSAASVGRSVHRTTAAMAIISGFGGLVPNHFTRGLELHRY